MFILGSTTIVFVWLILFEAHEIIREYARLRKRENGYPLQKHINHQLLIKSGRWFMKDSIPFILSGTAIGSMSELYYLEQEKEEGEKRRPLIILLNIFSHCWVY